MLSHFGLPVHLLIPDSVKQKCNKSVRKIIVKTTKKISPKIAKKTGAVLDASQRIDQTANNATRSVLTVLADGPIITVAKQGVATFCNSQGIHPGAQISDCKLGDHLKRTGKPIPVYSHHGIYIGDGKVMHYSGPSDNAKIRIVTLEEFAKGQTVIIVPKYESALLVSREEAVSRAWRRYGEKNYNLMLNNCENFVRWCRAGD